MWVGWCLARGFVSINLEAAGGVLWGMWKEGGEWSLWVTRTWKSLSWGSQYVYSRVGTDLCKVNSPDARWN